MRDITLCTKQSSTDETVRQMASVLSEPSTSSILTKLIKSTTASLPLSDPPPQPVPPAPEPPPSNTATLPLSDPPHQPVLPVPEPPPPSASSILPCSQLPLSSRRWTSLFENKPWNAGIFSPPPITLRFSGGALLPDEAIYEAGREVWQDYLVGFFLDAPLSFTVVTNYLQKHWKLTGGVKIKSTGRIFFFLFSNSEDRKRILNSDPVIIRSKLFIVKPWDCNVGSNCIKTVPVWVKITNIPLYAWSKIGICWLATIIGKFLCMDAATESLEKLSFAKCLVEITPSSPLPNEFPVLLPDGTVQNVEFEFAWKPLICNSCKSFGHSTDKCTLSGSLEINNNVEKFGTSNQGGSFVARDKYPGKNFSVSDRGKVMKVGVSNETWKKVDNKSKNFGKRTMEACGTDRITVQTRNMYKSLVDLTDEDHQHIEECTGEDFQTVNRSTGLTDRSGSGIPEEGEIIEPTEEGILNGNVAATMENVDNEHYIDNSAKVHTNIQSSELGSDACVQLEGTGNFDAMQTILSDVTDFEQTLKEGGFDVHVPLTVNNFQTSNAYGFKPGFLQGTSPLNKKQNETSVQSSMQVQPETVVLPAQQSALDTAANEIIGNLDSFLRENFDLATSNGNVKTKQSKLKEKTRPNIEKTVLETIASLGDEIDSGELDPYMCNEKRKLMELMSKNYTALQNRKVENPSGKKQVTNPYANIPAPPGYKPRPPDIIVADSPSCSTAGPGSGRKSPTTRSMTRAGVRTLFDNG